MSAHDIFGRDLEVWLSADAPSIAPAGLHGAVIERARRTGQRPGWLVDLTGGAPVRIGLMGRSGVRLAYVLLAVALIVVAFVIAVAAVAFLSDPLRSSRNGPIAYSIQGRHSFGNGFFPDEAHIVSVDGAVDRLIWEGTCPTFSPDGSHLFFRSGRGDTAELMIAGPDGSSPRVMPGIGSSQYALSPDGTRVAWFKRLTSDSALIGYGTAELWVTPVAGGVGTRIVTADSAENEFYSSPVWSHDSSQIAFARNVSAVDSDGIHTFRSAILVVGADGSNLRTITTRPDPRALEPYEVPKGISWSPDGRSIAYVGTPAGWPFTSPSPAPFGGPAWPQPGSPSEIFLIETDGTGDRSLGYLSAWDGQLTWSPDGTRLAYLTDTRDGTRLTTVRMDPGTAIGQVVVGPVANGFAWAPDGSRLLWSNDQEFGTVDASLTGPSTTLQRIDGYIQCTPSWQRLEPWR